MISPAPSPSLTRAPHPHPGLVSVARALDGGHRAGRGGIEGRFRSGGRGDRGGAGRERVRVKMQEEGDGWSSK